MTNVEDIVQLRLSHQQLTQHNFTTPTELVSWMGAIQAQDYAGAKWAVAQRLDSVAEEVIEQAFNDGQILRTHVLRPTWHLIAPADIRWMLQLTQSHVQAVNAYYFRLAKLDDEVFAQTHQIIAHALTGKNYLTRNQLAEILHQHGRDHDHLQMTYILMKAEGAGLICSGPRLGKQFTYALLEERVPETRQLSRDEALAELAKRYVFSHGPVQVNDFGQWSGLNSADAQLGIELAAFSFDQAVIEQKTYWFAAASPQPPSLPETVFLLPNYDEYGLSYQDRSAFFEPRHLENIDSHGSNFSHLIMFQGKIIGTWRRTLKTETVIIEASFFGRTTQLQYREFLVATERYGKYLHLNVVL